MGTRGCSGECCFFPLLTCDINKSYVHVTGVCAGGFMCVVGPGFDSTSPAVVRSRASQTERTDARPAQNEICPKFLGAGS